MLKISSKYWCWYLWQIVWLLAPCSFLTYSLSIYHSSMLLNSFSSHLSSDWT